MLKTFFDYDKIECCLIEDAMEEYPDLNWEKIRNRFSWHMGSRQDTEVMTLADLNICLVIDKSFNIEDYNYHEIEHCSVCRKVLLPDDEAYNDLGTNDVLCTEHATFNDVLDGYVKLIFN